MSTPQPNEDRGLSAAVVAKLDFYVYRLIDPVQARRFTSAKAGAIASLPTSGGKSKQATVMTALLRAVIDENARAAEGEETAPDDGVRHLRKRFPRVRARTRDGSLWGQLPGQHCGMK